MKKNTLLLLVISHIMISHSYAELILGEVQFNAGYNAVPDPIEAMAEDLLETSVDFVSAVNADALVFNGSTGYTGENSDENPARVWWPTTTTFTFNTSVNTRGYDINEIRLFSAWTDTRVQQNYKIFYSVVDDDNFVQLTDSNINIDNVSNGSLLTRTYDSDGDFILTGVDQLRFDFYNNDTIYREFDVIGSASPIPEGSNSALIVGVICLTSLLSSRSFFLRLR